VADITAYLKSISRFIIAFIIASSLSAQVNTAALRKEDLSPGLHTTLGTDMGLITGNSNLLQLKSSRRFE